MKKHFFLLLITALLFNACKEIPPVVTGSTGPVVPNDDVKDQRRQVLIEEFTGVRCVQCPGGSAFIQDLLAIHGQRLVAVSIHAGSFSNPYSINQYDFRTPEGTQLISYLDQPFGFPSAVINRTKFPGQFDLQLGQGDWAGYIAQDTAIAPKVRISIEPEFDISSRELKVNVKLFVDETIADPSVRLNIMITESGIEDAQITPGSSDPVPNYVHRHVLRHMLTNWDGDPITESLGAGTVVQKNFTYSMPAEWKEDNCEIVAFVSLAGTSKEVLQAHQVHVVE